MSFFSDLFGGGGVAPPAPDYSPIIGALQSQAAIGNQFAQQQYQWARDQYTKNQGQIEPTIANMQRLQSDALGASEQDRARYTSVYQPLEDQQIQTAKTWDSADNMDRMRGRAEADVSQNFDAQRENTMRDLESYGINPGAVRYAGLDSGFRAQKAAAMAAAGNQSDLATQQTAIGLRQGMIQRGQTMPYEVAQSAGTAMNAGTGATNSALGLTGTSAQTMGNPTQWYGGAGSVLGSAGNMMNDQFKNQLDSYKATQSSSSGLGSLLGAGAGLAMGVGGWGTGSVGGKLLGFADGGPVPQSAQPPGAPAIDGVPARLTPGEFVFPRDTVAHYGTDKLQKMIQKARGQTGKGAGGHGQQARPQTRQALPMAPTFRSAA